MMVLALTVEGAVRDSDLGEVMNELSIVVPANAGVHNHRH